jgi:hypothetical protein
MTLAIEEQLKDKAIQVELRDKGLAFITKSNMDDGLREMLATEGKDLYRMALEVHASLQVLAVAAEGNPTGWKALNKRITAKWPWDNPNHLDAYGHLVSWSGAWFMRTRALTALRGKNRALTHDEKMARKADISFMDRLIPNSERRLVSTCILWPGIRENVLRLKVGKGPLTKE